MNCITRPKSCKQSSKRSKNNQAKDVKRGQRLKTLNPSHLKSRIPQSQKKIKRLPLVTFYGKKQPSQHTISFNTQMVIIDAIYELKGNPLSKTLKGGSLALIHEFSYILCDQLPGLSKRLIHQFPTSKHRKVSTTSLFNVCQGNSKSLHEYLACFDKVTIKVLNYSQDIFVEYFYNELKI